MDEAERRRRHTATVARLVLRFTVTGGKIAEIDIVGDPDTLDGLEVTIPA